MQAHIKHIIVTLGFAVTILLGMVTHLGTADEDFSDAERRNLKQFPVPTWQTITDHGYSDTLETYLLDQFFLREGFRGLNAISRLYVFNQHDVNHLLVHNGHVHELMHPLDEASLENALSLMGSIKREHYGSIDTYHAYIPDKNRYLDKGGVPVMDYGAIADAFDEPGFDSKPIDLSALLTIDHYYRTDHHWDQKTLPPIAAHILNVMKDGNVPNANYDTETYKPFRGVYQGQLGLPLENETLGWLVNDTIRNAERVNPITGESETVYDTEKLHDVDPYHLFLGGYRPITELQTDNHSTDEHLVIFGDSFTNSLAPLLMEAYEKITFVDLRYISPNILDEYIEEEPDDVLFLYSTHILNDSWMLN